MKDIVKERRLAKKQSGHPNVTWHSLRSRWIGRFLRHGKMNHVGYWQEDDLDEAVEKTRRAAQRYDESPLFKKRTRG